MESPLVVFLGGHNTLLAIVAPSVGAAPCVCANRVRFRVFTKQKKTQKT